MNFIKENGEINVVEFEEYIRSKLEMLDSEIVYGVSDEKPEVDKIIFRVWANSFEGKLVFLKKDILERNYDPIIDEIMVATRVMIRQIKRDLKRKGE